MIELIREEDKPAIVEFCRKYNVRLIDVVESWEQGFRDVHYVFNDNLGNYSVEGLRDSLEDMPLWN